MKNANFGLSRSRRMALVLLVASLPMAQVSYAAACSVPGDPGAGKAVYNETCIACHGADGGGAVPGVPKLNNGDGPLAKPDAVLIANITNGFSSGRSALSMPPKGGNPDLTEKDILNVLGYMRKTFACK